MLALDADTLASLASQGSLDGLLRGFVLEDPVTEAELVDGAVLRTVDGNDLALGVAGRHDFAPNCFVFSASFLT